MKRKLKIGLSIVVVIVIAAFVVVSIMDANITKLVDAEISEIDLSSIADGVYLGKCTSLPISVKVEVTVQDNQIVNIELLRHFNGQGSAAEVIPDMVVAAQKLDVDMVSGATHSSKAIIKAIEDALIN